MNICIRNFSGFYIQLFLSRVGHLCLFPNSLFPEAFRQFNKYDGLLYYDISNSTGRV